MAQVHAGPPIQIGWTPQKIDLLELDIYEVFRHRRRDRHALQLSTYKRTEALLLHGYTEDEILAACAECERVKYERLISTATSSSSSRPSEENHPATASNLANAIVKF
jgi:hypothetical protein